MRAIIWAIIAYILFSLVRRWRVSQAPAQRVNQHTGASMVRCTTCGTFVLPSEAVVVGNNLYCHSTCRDAGQTRQ